MSEHGEAAVFVTPSNGVKCPRCWHYHHVRENYDGLCDRCQRVIVEDFPGHWSAQGILEALDMQRKKYSVVSE